MSVCRIGTRKSALAKVQSQSIADHLTEQGIQCAFVEMQTRGDSDRANPLYEMESESPGLFCKQLEDALLRGEIDIAVHSLKDLPTRQPPGLVVVAIPRRETAEDRLIVHPRAIDEKQPFHLKQVASVGTSSLRREAQILEARGDLKVSPLRGNVPSRVAQVRDGKLDAALLAGAGLKRLQLDLQGVVAIPLSAERFVPAPGQGAIAVEAREDLPSEWLEAVRKIHDAPTANNVTLERRILRDLEGGCTLPLGVLCRDELGGVRSVRAFLGIARNRAEGRRDWVSFHRFDISGTHDETLVSETVRYFKERMSH